MPAQSLRVGDEDEKGGGGGGGGGECWCGAQGVVGGDLAGDCGWTGLEDINGDEREGPEVLLHAEDCTAGRCAALFQCRDRARALAASERVVRVQRAARL